MDKALPTTSMASNPGSEQNKPNNIGTKRTRDDIEGEWQVAGRKTKKPKKIKPPKPQGPPKIWHSPNTRLQSQVKIRDVQQLVLSILVNESVPPWIAVKNPRSIERVVLLMVPGLDMGLFNGQVALEMEDGMIGGAAATTSNGHATTKGEGDSSSPDDYYPSKLTSFKLHSSVLPLARIFEHVWPIKAPGDQHYTRVFDPVYEMLQSPFPKTAEEKHTKGPMTSAAASRNFDNKRTPITDYVLDLETLTENGFTIHPAYASTEVIKEQMLEDRRRDGQTMDDGWVDSKVFSLEEAQVPVAEMEGGSLNEGRSVYSIDCEFVKVEGGGYAATRVSVLDWNGQVVFDELVQPDKEVTDYLTEFSGMTKEKLQNVTTTLAQIQDRLLTLLTPRAILMGHSLESDLSVLKLTHPFMVDTSVLFPHPLGAPRKSALKWLTKKYLNRDIQSNGPKGHDSVEDARAVLDLVRQKCERGPLWGTGAGNLEPLFKRVHREIRPSENDGNDSIPLEDDYRRSAAVDWGTPSKGLGAHAQIVIGCQNDTEVVEGVKKLMEATQNADQESSREDIDLVFARLRELEAVRGWWWRSVRASSTSQLDELRNATLARFGIADIPEEGTDINPSPKVLTEVVATTVDNITKIHASLPANTAFIIFSGIGDKREVNKLQALQQQFNREYKERKWDDLTVKWTDNEAQALRQAVRRAREGIGFVTVKT